MKIAKRTEDFSENSRFFGTARNVGWQSLSTVSVQAVQAIVTLLVASKTTPEEFALVGIAIVVFNAQFLISESLGLGQALIYYDNQARFQDAVDTSFLTISVVGSLSACILFIGAPVIGGIFIKGFSQNAVSTVMRVMSIFLLFAAMASVPQALIEKSHSFKRRSLVEMIAVFVYSVAAIVLLASGAGVWSIIIARPIQSFLLALLFWLAAPVRPRFPPRFHWDTLKDLFRYGKFIGGVAIIGFVMGNLDNVIIGGLAGAGALGSYALAYTLANLVPTFLTQTISKVFFPLYSSLRAEPNAIETSYAAAFQVTGLLIVPTTICLITVAPGAMVEIFGINWSQAEDLIRILAIYGFARACGVAATTLLNAIGRPNITLWSVILALIVPLGLLWPLRGYGASGIALAFTIGQGASALFAIVHSRSYWSSEMFYQLIRTTFAGLFALLLAMAFVKISQINRVGVLTILYYVPLYVCILWAIDPRMRNALAICFGYKGRNKT